MRKTKSQKAMAFCKALHREMMQPETDLRFTKRMEYEKVRTPSGIVLEKIIGCTTTVQVFKKGHLPKAAK